MNDGMKTVEENSWFVWSKHVLIQLESHSKCLNEIKKEQTAIKVEIAKLKVKAGIWGLISGAVPVAIGLGIWLIKQP